MKRLLPLLFLLALTSASVFGQGQVPTTTWLDQQGYGAGIPSGVLILLVSGTCPTGFTEVSALNGQFLQGTVAANGDVGTTGGNATITPAGTVSQPTFTGNSVDPRPLFTKVIFCSKN